MATLTFFTVYWGCRGNDWLQGAREGLEAPLAGAASFHMGGNESLETMVTRWTRDRIRLVQEWCRDLGLTNMKTDFIIYWSRYQRRSQRNHKLGLGMSYCGGLGAVQGKMSSKPDMWIFQLSLIWITGIQVIIATIGSWRWKENGFKKEALRDSGTWGLDEENEPTNGVWKVEEEENENHSVSEDKGQDCS